VSRCPHSSSGSSLEPPSSWSLWGPAFGSVSKSAGPLCYSCASETHTYSPSWRSCSRRAKRGGSPLLGLFARSGAFLALLVCLSLTLSGCSTPTAGRPLLPPGMPSELILVAGTHGFAPLDMSAWFYADGMVTVPSSDMRAVFEQYARWVSWAKALLRAGRFLQ